MPGARRRPTSAPHRSSSGEEWWRQRGGSAGPRWTLRAPPSLPVPVLYLLTRRRSVYCAAALAVAACGDVRLTDRPNTATEIRDDYGHVVKLGAPAKRIVSLNPATTEILFAIGAGTRVVGRTQYDLWPDS